VRLHAILADSKTDAGITTWQSPNFYAYFLQQRFGTSILGVYCLPLGRSGHALVDEPCCTEVENADDGLAAGMLELPKKFLSTSAGGGVHSGTASSDLWPAFAGREHAPPSRPIARL